MPISENQTDTRLLPSLTLSTGSSSAPERITRQTVRTTFMLYRPLFGKYDISLGAGFNRAARRMIEQWICGKRYLLATQGVECVVPFLQPGPLGHAFDALPRAYQLIVDYCLDNGRIAESQLEEYIKDFYKRYRALSEPGCSADFFTNGNNAASFLVRTAAGIYSLDSCLAQALAVVRGKTPGRRTVRTVSALPDSNAVIFNCEEQIVASLAEIDRAFSMELVPGLLSKPEATVSETVVKRCGLLVPLKPMFTSGLQQWNNFSQCALWSLLKWVYIDNKDAGSTATSIFATPAELKNALFDFRLGVRRLSALTANHFAGDLARPFGLLFDDSFVDDIIKVVQTHSSRMLAPGARDQWIGLGDIVAAQKQPPSELVAIHFRSLVADVLCVLASVGFVEAAFKKPCRTTEDLEAVRFTALGRYVFGLDTQYSSPVRTDAVVSPRISVDTDALYLFTDDKRCASMLASRYARRITLTRFVVTPESFCRGIGDVQTFDMRVEYFRLLLRLAEFPQVWRDFFANLRGRFSQISNSGAEFFIVYSLAEASPELLDFILNDPEVRELVILAQGRRLFVRPADEPRLALCLQNAGYTLPRIMR